MDPFSSPCARFNLFVRYLLRGVWELHGCDPDFLLEENLSHHPFVLVAQQMAVEERYASDDRVGELILRPPAPLAHLKHYLARGVPLDFSFRKTQLSMTIGFQFI
jgi:hypothetical protein